MSVGFLLDTNVPSELTRLSPAQHVVEWVNSQTIESLFLSAISIGELRRGFSLLDRGKRLTQLESWFSESLLPLFEDRVLSVTASVGDRWGVLSAERQLQGAPLNVADGLIAATALEHGLTMVTRNIKDFSGLGLALFNPWENLVPPQ